MSALPEAARIRFRPMNDADIDSVMKNERAAYSHPWSEGIFRDCMHSGYSCWVAEADSGVVGHGVMSVAIGETHILNICVGPESQGRGYGRALLRHLLELSRDYGALMAFLEVRPSNLAAVNLYESLGFSEVGRRRNYYPAGTGREDAIVMALGLDEREQDELD